MVEIKFEQKNQIMLIVAVTVIFVDWVIMRGTPFFVPIIAVAFTLFWLPYWMDIMRENKRQKELETRFPDFVRNLTGAIKSGMPASQAVIHVADTDYGALSPYVKKLANQLEWSIPFHRAFLNFGKDANSHLIKRSIATMIQAERAGGNLEDVLLAITNSLVEIKKIKEERKSSIHSQVMQSYVIFMVFLGVMIVIQNLLIPYMDEFGTGGESIAGGAGNALVTSVAIDFSSPVALIATFSAWFISLHGVFLMIALIQGMFAGAVLGKLAEGDMTSGLKHSAILMTVAFMAMTFFQSLATVA